jgi:hypothetical protein
MTPKEAIDRIDAISYATQFIDGYRITLKDDGLWLETAKLALYRMIPQFVLCPKGWQGVKKTRYYCPSCKGMTREHEKFCHKCGQAVKYPKLARSDNKLVLDWGDGK